MKFRKLTIASAVCVALAGASGLANAAITGVPGEALLVTGVMTGAGDVPSGTIETNIGIRVPVTIGSDTVINTYTAPHTTVSDTTTVQVIDDPRIYWTLYNENSVKIEDGECEISLGDVVLWTTDRNVRFQQQLQQAGILAAGIQDIPSPVCGPTLRPRFGYVIFQTISGADGRDADFAMTADAGSHVTPLLWETLSIPVMPMADGADPLPAGSGFPEFQNEVITGTATYGDNFPTSPIRYSPITPGIRLSDADAVTTENLITQMPIPGPAAGSPMALHVLWYPNNDASRWSFGDIFDDSEGRCSQPTYLPRQLNALLYNVNVDAAPPGFPPAANWNNVFQYIDVNEDGEVLDLIGQVMGSANGSSPYCAPPYWRANALGATDYPGAILGYNQYAVPEYNFGLDDGAVHAAGVQFAAVYHPQALAWSTHVATDLGKQ